MKKNIIVPTVTLFIICLVATALLAVSNYITAPIIDELAVKTEIETRKTVLPEASDFEDREVNGVKFAEGIGKDGKAVGSVFTTTAKSYGGEILVMTGVDKDGKITGVELLKINDTAGLGMKAKNPEFKEQYKGLVSGVKVMKNSSDPDNNEITALTGATITSNAVTEAVNTALDNFAKTAGKDGAK